MWLLRTGTWARSLERGGHRVTDNAKFLVRIDLIQGGLSGHGELIFVPGLECFFWGGSFHSTVRFLQVTCFDM